MISQLHIKNIALIEDCLLSFGAQLNVLSGETGAGKSIIIDSLGFALGARADKGLIRHGATTASVEAVFDLSDSPNVRQKMLEIGLEDEDTLVIYRSMTESRSEIRLNGRSASLSMLKELGTSVVDILGQHENQSLLSVSSHVELLDKYGGDGLLRTKEEVCDLYHRLKESEEKLRSYGDEKDRARRMDVLKYQIDEIRAAELKEGQEEDLLALREKFRNSEKIINAVGVSASAIEGDDSFSIQNVISAAMSALRQATSYDSALEALYERLDSSYLELRDILDELHSYLDSFDFDAATADFVEKRLDLIRSMKRKYGTTIEEILENLSRYEDEYQILCDADVEIEKLTHESAVLREETMHAARSLSEKRRTSADKLKLELEGELAQLGMSGSIFEVSMLSGEELLSEQGYDRVEFLISPNPGEPVRSLSKIISGGEMSRFMLAMKVITARLDGIRTLVFDEVDAGISGRIGEVVAEKLAIISSVTQVIAITHLPQVAAMSDDHYLIEKGTKENVTRTALIKLDEEGVVKEVERLSAGMGTYGALHARELRAYARDKKMSLRSMNR